MVRTLHRAPSTISRELLRNTTGGKAYSSHVAQQDCQAPRRAAKPEIKLNVDGFAWLRVLTLLDWRWWPQQISGTLKRVFPNDPTHHVSHETIYIAIYAQPRGELRRDHNTRMPHTRGLERRGQIPDMLSIHVRPPEIEDRVMPGHWEGNFIKGAANQSSVGVLVKRSSRLVLLAKMQLAHLHWQAFQPSSIRLPNPCATA
jgi:transposase, IS30 family